MKCFEVGKEYHINGGGTIRITKRTDCYISYAGTYDRKTNCAFISMPIHGRKKICKDDLFGLGENVMLPVGVHMQLFCFAGNEV